MKTTKQIVQQIEHALQEVITKYPQGAVPVMTDIHLQVNPSTGELRAFNDDDEELESCVVEGWYQNNSETFFDDVATALRRGIENLRPAIQEMSILQPFSFVLVDEEHETLQDLVYIDQEETLLLDGTLLEGLEEDMDAFLKHLLQDE